MHVLKDFKEDLPLVRHRQSGALADLSKLPAFNRIHQFLLNDNYYCLSKRPETPSFTHTEAEKSSTLATGSNRGPVEHSSVSAHDWVTAAGL